MRLGSAGTTLKPAEQAGVEARRRRPRAPAPLGRRRRLGGRAAGVIGCRAPMGVAAIGRPAGGGPSGGAWRGRSATRMPTRLPPRPRSTGGGPAAADEGPPRPLPTSGGRGARRRRRRRLAGRGHRTGRGCASADAAMIASRGNGTVVDARSWVMRLDVVDRRRVGVAPGVAGEWRGRVLDPDDPQGRAEPAVGCRPPAQVTDRTGMADPELVGVEAEQLGVVGGRSRAGAAAGSARATSTTGPAGSWR